MIDWVSAILPLQHEPIDSGCVMKILPSGAVDWQTPCRHSITGSFSSNITVKSNGSNGQGQATHIYFSGNPSKFLQGHNLFGSDHILTLMLDAYHAICNALNVRPTSSDLKAVEEGDYEITRVDINQSFALSCRSDVRSWLRAAEFKSRTRAGRSQLKGSTLYFNKTSSRWSFKFYSKGDEIEARNHQLPDELRETPLTEWADNILRAELTLRKKEMTKINITHARDLTINFCHSLFSEYMGRIQMSEQLSLSHQELSDLPARLKSTYVLWRSGEDPRSLLTKRTYYRHRKELLSFGIDIAIIKEQADLSNVVPLIRILEAKPVPVPKFAFKLSLVHRSATP